MLNRATKVAMLLAAFSLAFSLVCPVAVTPIFVTSHHQAPAVHLTIDLALSAMSLPRIDAPQPQQAPPSLLDTAELSCALRC